MSSNEQPLPTVLSLLNRILTGLQTMTWQVTSMRADLSTAYEVAVKEGRPTAQIRLLQGEFDALQGLVAEQILVMVQKMAEVEAGTRG